MSNFLNFSGNQGVTFKDHGTGGGTSFTLDVNASTNSVMLSVGGVMQSPVVDYTVSGTTVTTTSSVTSGVEVLSYVIHKPGTAPIIQDNSISNAKMLDDAVGLAELSATGTPSSSNFLRGDNAWADPGGGAIEKLFIADNSGNQVVGTGAWTTVTFDTETLDQGSHFASNKFTAPSTGKYMFFCTHMYLESSGTVDQRMSLNHYNSSDSLQLQRSVFKTTVHEASMSGVGAFSMSASDYVLMQVYHAKGSNANLYKAQMFGWRVV